MNTRWAAGRTNNGFTIVELIIVITVIAILAAITTVAYNGVQQRAKDTATKLSATQTADKIIAFAAPRNGIYPATLSEVGIVDTAQAGYQYTREGRPQTFCLTTMTADGNLYQRGDGEPETGICPGHNLAYWNKKRLNETVPIQSATIDTSVFRNATASVRIAPGQTGREVSGGPYGTAVGEAYTVSLWMRTDSNWNGTSNNSKIRIAHGTSNAIIKACGYNGVKTSWTQVTCTFTTSSTNPTIRVQVGNDGSAGNIWIDDLSVTQDL